MATILSAESTQHAQNGAQKAIAFHHAQRIGGLSRILERDIEILRVNLVQLHDGRDEARSSAWERLESAWETVRSELADDTASSPLTGDVSPGNGAAAAAAEVDAPVTVVPTVPLALRVLKWITGVLGPAISTRTRQAVRWACEPARRAELRAAALNVSSFVSSAALTGARHVSIGWCGLQGVVRNQAAALESTRLRLEGDLQTWKAARSHPAEIKASAGAIEVEENVRLAATKRYARCAQTVRWPAGRDAPRATVRRIWCKAIQAECMAPRGKKERNCAWRARWKRRNPSWH